MTPKTESGRALIARLYPSVAPDGSGRQPGFVWAEYDHLQIDILAIEQEAASVAVAEALDAAEAVIEWLGPCDHFDHHGNCQTHGVEKPCRVETLRALIASERGT